MRAQSSGQSLTLGAIREVMREPESPRARALQTPTARSRGASLPASSRSASTPVSVPPKVGTRSDVSWTKAEDVTARVDFDQPRVPSADSIPSKGWS